MKTIWTIILITTSFIMFGQTTDALTKDEELIIDYIEVAPSFPGGQEGLKKYLDKNFKWTQEQTTVNGKVFVEFWIEKNGEIKDAKVIRGLSETCDKEALRLVTEMPKWTPAKQKEKPIRTRMVLPIKFEL